MIIPIICVSYHRPIAFIKCIESILKNTDDFKLYVIDNSCGGLDHVFNNYNYDDFYLIRTEKNLGKGRAFAQYFPNTKCKYFVSIDPDVIVCKNWLKDLISVANSIDNLGILGPQYLDLKYDNSSHITNDRYIPGMLYLIDFNSYNFVKKYPVHHLYGVDDGLLRCAMADNGFFVGRTNKVIVEHFRDDEPVEYKNWKKDHIKNKTIGGFWD